MKKFTVLIAITLLFTGCKPQDSADIAVTGVTISQTTATLNRNGSIELTATVKPANATNKTITWSISDKNRAAVTVTAANKATVSIPATAPAGDVIVTVTTKDRGFTANCKITVSIPADPYATFKASVTPRSEGAAIATMQTHLLCGDKGGLFASTKYKAGFCSRDGSSYYFVEWTGGSTVGVKTNPTLRTQTGVVNLNSLEVIKSESGLLWIVYVTTAGIEGRIIVKGF